MSKSSSHFRIIDIISLGFFRLLLRKFSSSPVMEITNEDEDVRTERLRVESGAAEFDLVQLYRLTKTYQLIHKKIIAVNNISIGIPAGEVRKRDSFLSLFLVKVMNKNYFSPIFF